MPTTSTRHSAEQAAQHVAEQAAAATHELALLTRPAITCLDAAEIAGLPNTLTSLAAAVNQTLRQLSNYNTGGHASGNLQNAATVAGQLVGALNTAHHNLGDTAEPPESEPGGVNFRPTKRGQISTGVDKRQITDRFLPDRAGTSKPGHVVARRTVGSRAGVTMPTVLGRSIELWSRGIVISYGLSISVHCIRAAPTTVAHVGSHLTYRMAGTRLPCHERDGIAGGQPG